jgi:hypothetical protein
MENQFAALAAIDVSKHIEKKGNLSYLSWPWAVEKLMRADPMACWEFHAPEMYGESMMVSCTVTAFGKPIKMHLPVMDHRNQAAKNPDAVLINKNMMRCLVKAIACHGLGLHIYAGEDLPLDEDGNRQEKPRPEPKPEPKVERVTPKVIEGKDTDWKMKITMIGENDNPEDWLGVLNDMTSIALSTATSTSQVMAIFKANADIFNKAKAIDAAAYDKLLDKFKEAKAKLTAKETE